MLVPVFGISTVHLECLQEALEPSSSLAQALFPSARPVGPFSRPVGRGGQPRFRVLGELQGTSKEFGEETERKEGRS